MTQETLMTEAAATTNEGQAASETTATEAATVAEEGGQQQETQGKETQDNGETKTDGDKDKPQGAPEKYEFTAPEGKEYNPAMLADLSEAAKELNLPQESAQKLIDKMAPAFEARQVEALSAAREQWATDAKADKEYGGEKLSENLALAQKAIETFGTPELRTLLNESGLGNHPEVIRVFVRAGKAISEDGFVAGGSGAVNKQSPKSLYGNTEMNP